MQNYLERALQFVRENGLKVLVILLLVFVTFKLINFLMYIIRKGMERKSIDPSVISFILLIFSIVLKAVVLISALEYLGVNTSSLLALLGAAGLAIGLSLQGTLSNLAGGILLIVLRRFRTGDFIEAQGYSGTVKEITLFTTKLLTADKKTIFISNGALASGNLVNYSLEPIRRVDMVFGIGYNDDLKKAKQLLENLLTSHPLVLEDPAPIINVAALGDSSVNFNVRPFTQSGDYWTVYSDIHEQVKLTFDQQGISIPFPQQDVHLYKE